MIQADTLLALTDAGDRATTGLILAGIEASGVAAALYGPDDTLAYGSPAFRALFDVRPDARDFSDIMRHCHANGIGAKMNGSFAAWMAMAQEKRRSQEQRTFEIDIQDDRWYLVNETRLAGGWLWSTFTDISMLKSNERVLRLARDAAELAAETDPLTGLFNRRAAMDRLDAAIRSAGRGDEPLSLVLFDLDHFKAINDTHGHATGDRVLCHFAAAGRSRLRAQDVFARVGGEEFMVLMPGTAAAEAARAVERLRRHIARDADAPGGAYTFSAGVAEHRGGTAQTLFDRADDALYRAKHRGRDRVERAA
jgi:diguanylate cyclase (GGDEF)-like protein